MPITTKMFDPTSNSAQSLKHTYLIVSASRIQTKQTSAIVSEALVIVSFSLLIAVFAILILIVMQAISYRRYLL
jgi:hypothetical protein